MPLELDALQMARSVVKHTIQLPTCVVQYPRPNKGAIEFDMQPLELAEGQRNIFERGGELAIC